MFVDKTDEMLKAAYKGVLEDEDRRAKAPKRAENFVEGEVTCGFSASVVGDSAEETASYQVRLSIPSAMGVNTLAFWFSDPKQLNEMKKAIDAVLDKAKDAVKDFEKEQEKFSKEMQKKTE